MLMLIVKCCLVLLQIIHSSPQLTQFKKQDILPANYDADTAPTLDGQPVIVNVSLNTYTIKPSSSTQTVDVVLWMMLYWNDYRLMYPKNFTRENITLKDDWIDELWTPDVYFYSASSVSLLNTINPSLFFVINSTTVAMAARLYMTLNCDMRFEKYPFDTQVCSIILESLSENVDVLQLRWVWCNFMKTSLPEYVVSLDDCETLNENYEDIGGISRLRSNFTVKRNFGKFILKRYIPSFIIVVIAFLGFWIPATVPPARVTLNSTALLNLIAQQINQELAISYIFALEVWNIICVLFVFACFVELPFAIAFPYKEKGPKSEEIADRNSRYYPVYKFIIKLLKFLRLKSDPRHSLVDVCSRVVFPTLFAITIIIYSLVYYFVKL